MKDVCSRGHQLFPDNFSWQLSGDGRPFQRCRICNSDRAKDWRKKNAYRLERKRDGVGHPGQTLICR